ncbi:MAG: hypothetical protein IK083_09625 [Abditibacteriota bacterium]|nr:hypothetical protein [Abditibacteriota bacterium]
MPAFDWAGCSRRKEPFLLADGDRLRRTLDRLELVRYGDMLRHIARLAEEDTGALFNPDCIALDIDKKHAPRSYGLMSLKTRLFAISAMMLLTGDRKYVELAEEAMESFLAEPVFAGGRGVSFGVASPETAAVVKGLSVLADTFGAHGDPELIDKVKRYLCAVSQRLCEILSGPSEEAGADRDVVCDIAVSLCMSAMLLSDYDVRSSRWFDAAAKHILDYLDTIPPDGSHMRGVIRWQYVMGSICLFINALYSFSGIDHRQHPALARSRRFAIDLAAPLAGEINIMEDDVKLSIGRQLYGFASRALAVWFADPLIGWGISRERMPGRWAQPEEIFFMDYPAGAAAPRGRSVIYPFAGFAVLRSGYDRNDMLISLKSTRSVATPYGDRYCTQNDIQLFLGSSNMLINNGIAWSQQPNFFDRYRSETAHNSIYHEGVNVVSETEGTITGFHAGELADLVTARAVYDCNGEELPFYRSIAFVKPDIIVMYDNIQSPAAGCIQWLWHGNGRFYVNSLDPVQGFSLVESAPEPRTLRVHLFKPASWSYSIGTGYLLEDWVTGHESTHSVLTVREAYRTSHRLLAVLTGSDDAMDRCRLDEQNKTLSVSAPEGVCVLDYSGDTLQAQAAGDVPQQGE